MNKLNKTDDKMTKVKEKTFLYLSIHLMILITFHALIFWMAIFYKMKFSNLGAIIFFVNPVVSVCFSQFLLILLVFIKKWKNNEKIFAKILFWYITSNVMVLMSSICIMFVTFLNIVLPNYSTMKNLIPNILSFVMSIIIIFMFNYFSIYKISPVYKKISIAKNKTKEELKEE